MVDKTSNNKSNSRPSKNYKNSSSHGGNNQQINKNIKTFITTNGQGTNARRNCSRNGITCRKSNGDTKIAQDPVSLETPIGEEDDSHLGDFIQDEDSPAPQDSAAYTLLKEQLAEVMGTLTPREEKY